VGEKGQKQRNQETLIGNGGEEVESNFRRKSLEGRGESQLGKSRKFIPRKKPQKKLSTRVVKTMSKS